jgi:hypothetical protein
MARASMATRTTPPSVKPKILEFPRLIRNAQRAVKRGIVKYRPRSVLGPLVWALSAILLGLLVVLAITIIRRSLKTDDPLQPILNNNYIASLFVGAVFYAIAWLIVIPRRIALYAPVFGDDRDVLTWPELAQQFDSDASCRRLKEWGWELAGQDTESCSRLSYKSSISGLVTVTAQFKAICRQPKNKYWRCGIVFDDANGAEKICVHVDNHNLLVGYLGRQLVLQVTVPFNLQGRFVTISCQLSVAPNSTNTSPVLRAFCQINNATYCLGDMPVVGWPWKLQLRAWSDTQKNHHVVIRDISVSKVLA